MIDTLVLVHVKPDMAEDFLAATLENQRNSRKEPANVRFDVLRDNADPDRFILCEVYEDEAGAAAHKATAHYQKWRDTVAPMMAEPRSSIKTTPVAFD
jgi:autoinducer 2-degrading protein